MAKVVVAFPKFEQKDLDWIQSIRKEKDLLYYDVIDPHFTIVFPVFTNISDADFIAHIENKAADFKSFDFELTKAILNKDAFNEYWHAFLVPDKGDREIIALHDLMYEGLLRPELRLDIPFISHIGIANDKDQSKMKILIAKLNKDEIKISGRIDSLDICQFDEKITTIKKINLSGREL